MGKVIGDIDQCFLCGRYERLERHHCFGASNRKKSEIDGLCVMLCHNCHNEPPYGAHHNAETMHYLHRIGQHYAEKELGMTREEFMKRYGENYLYLEDLN